jgi:riboflavin kinase/FMN adenylyltransferase
VRILTVEEVAGAGVGSAVTVGTYDGVHLGHRRLLGILREKADTLAVPAAVVTFDRHPATVVRPGSSPLLLTDNEQKLELLASCGVDLTVVVRFDAKRAAEPPEDFVDEVLCDALAAKAVVVGEDFRFGRGRSGDVTMLRRLGAIRGFDVTGVHLVAAEGTGADDGDGGAGGTGAAGGAESISSTRIRALIAMGDVQGAARLLGRPHEVRGRVVHGDGRGGSQLGVPTANVDVPKSIAVPALGIYAGWCRRADGSSHPAAISVGIRPTFAASSSTPAPLVEAHLIGFDGDLYAERVGVAFVERLREERRFERVEDLVAQMRADVDVASRLLTGDA